MPETLLEYDQNNSYNPHMEDVRIDDREKLHKGVHVLSSTKAVVNDPRYIMDCWAKVNDTIESCEGGLVVLENC